MTGGGGRAEAFFQRIAHDAELVGGAGDAVAVFAGFAIIRASLQRGDAGVAADRAGGQFAPQGRRQIAKYLGLVGGDPVERLGKILPPFLSTAKSAAVVRQMIDAVGTVRARDALTRQMPKEPEKQFRARLALWVIEHLEKGRIV